MWAIFDRSPISAPLKANGFADLPDLNVFRALRKIFCSLKDANIKSYAKVMI